MSAQSQPTIAFCMGILFLLLCFGATHAQEIEGSTNSVKLPAAPIIGDMSMGSTDAPVTVVEYASASCPYCAAFYMSHFGALKAAYVDKGKVQFVLREYPHNDAALGAFMVARCAPKEKYFSLIDQFFREQEIWTKAPAEELLRMALEAGLSAEQYDKCVNNEKLSKEIVSIRNAARTNGVDEVPAFFIDGELFTGEKTYEALSVEIDRLLK